MLPDGSWGLIEWAVFMAGALAGLALVIMLSRARRK